MLEVDSLHVSVAGKAILNGLSLSVRAGEKHAIMGPNGSGKSTLANVLAGREGYVVTSGSVRFFGEDILEMEPEERARMGLFLAFQYPVEIPGVSNLEFLKAAVDSRAEAAGREPPTSVEFMKAARAAAAELELSADFLKRGVNEGFSGGEKKRNEILQLKLLAPRLAVLDETDSGLDIDALQTVARGVNAFATGENAVLLITHYQRLLDHVVPDFVHVLANGRIAKTGDADLAKQLEETGYAALAESAA